jgi:putative DNA primase/helicase
VLLATEEYRRGENVVGRFVAERCIRGEEFISPATSLFESFCKWARTVGLGQLSQKDFGTALSELGFDNRKYGKARRSHWFGLGLIDEATGELPEVEE